MAKGLSDRQRQILRILEASSKELSGQELHKLGSELDANGFVVDFSSLKELRKQLNHQFDHTFLANSDDPLLSEWERLHELGALDLRVMGNVGMEGSAHWVWEQVNALLQERDGGRSWCWKVEARENSSNAAYWEAKPDWALDHCS